MYRYTMYCTRQSLLTYTQTQYNLNQQIILTAKNKNYTIDRIIAANIYSFAIAKVMY